MQRRNALNYDHAADRADHLTDHFCRNAVLEQASTPGTRGARGAVLRPLGFEEPTDDEGMEVLPELTAKNEVNLKMNLDEPTVKDYGNTPRGETDGPDTDEMTRHGPKHYLKDRAIWSLSRLRERLGEKGR